MNDFLNRHNPMEEVEMEDPALVDADEDIPPATGRPVRIKKLKWKKVLGHKMGKDGKLIAIGYETTIPTFLYERFYRNPDGTWTGRGEEWGSKVTYTTLLEAVNTVQAKFEAKCLKFFLEYIE